MSSTGNDSLLIQQFRELGISDPEALLSAHKKLQANPPGMFPKLTEEERNALCSACADITRIFNALADPQRHARPASG